MNYFMIKHVQTYGPYHINNVSVTYWHNEDKSNLNSYINIKARIELAAELEYHYPHCNNTDFFYSFQ